MNGNPDDASFLNWFDSVYTNNEDPFYQQRYSLYGGLQFVHNEPFESGQYIFYVNQTEGCESVRISNQIKILA